MSKVETIIANIQQRRTIKPEACALGQIPDEQIWQILECANWAPTHGYTEPWRFVVYGQVAKFEFSQDHAEMYKHETTAEKFKQVSYDKILERAGKCSHIIALVSKRGSNPKIAEIEEIQATAMAIQNMQLAAAAMGYAAYINSGGMCYHPSMKKYLGFESEDQVLGFLYLGIPLGANPEGRRITSIQEKVVWK